MPDPFDFRELRSHAPKYMGMDSLKEALESEIGPGEDAGNMNIEFQSERLETEQDVSMRDEESEDHSFSEERTQDHERSLLHNLMSPTDAGARLALNSAPSDMQASPKAASSEAAFSEAASLEAASSKPSSPSQLQVSPLPKSHLQPSRPDYNYDLRMPLPTPWHQNFSYTLSTYLQLVYNAGVLVVLAYFLNVINSDVSRKMEERSSKIIRDATWCQHQYVSNMCGTGQAPPHLVDNKRCLELEHCMEADPDNVRRISMYASLLAEVIGEFVQPLSYRAVLSISIVSALIFLMVFGINYLFGFIRARAYLNHEWQRNEPFKRDGRFQPELKLSATRGSHNE